MWLGEIVAAISFPLRRWRRARAGTSGGNLDELRCLVRADAAWYVSGDGQGTGPTSVVVPWTPLEDSIRRGAAPPPPPYPGPWCLRRRGAHALSSPAVPAR